MANTRFQHKRSTTSGVVPTTSDIAAGELGLNLADRRIFTSNGSAVFELGANLSSLAVGNSTVRQVTNTTGVFVNGSINLVRNDTRLTFTPVGGGANVYFAMQNDDNFVFYTTNTTGGTKAVFNVYANTNAPNQNSAFKFNVPIDTGGQGVYANNSLGTSGQVLTTNGAGVYWSSISAGVNTAAQFAWTNTHTFSANVSFNGNGIGIASNTGAVYLGGLADANWRIGRNTGGTTKRSYTNNTIDVIIASSVDEGFVIGVVGGNTVFETGYKGTLITGNVSIGNATVFTTVNATSFSGAANSATFASSSATNTFTVGTASYFVTNGNLGIGTSSPSFSLDVAGTIRAQATTLSGDVLIIGNDSKLVDIDVAHTAGLYSTTNTQIAGLRLGSNGVTMTAVNGRLGISNTTPDATLTVTGTANVSGNVVVGGSLNAANVTATVFTGSLTGTASNATNLNSQPGSFYTNATNLATGTVPTARLGSGTASATTFLAGDQSYKTAVTSVATGNGLTGGTVTTTGTVSVLANNGITANTTGLFVTQGTGAVVNSTGVHVNSTFIGTLTANNATNLNGQAASFYTNASNITTGTLPMAQLGGNVVNTTGTFTISGIHTHTANVVMGNTTVNTQYSNAVILISNATSTTTLGLTDLRIGNTSSNIVISNTTSSFAGNVAITGSANAANVTAAIFTGNLTGTAANSTNLNSQPGSFYTNATNLATGTVPTARLGSGTANASTFLRGDQTWAAAGGSLAGGELFNINVSAAVGYAVNTTMSAAFSAPSTAGLEYVVHSIQVTNIGTANATVSGEFSGTTYSSISFALTVPVPRESAVELLKMPKVMQPSDILRLQADQNSTLHAYITYETISSTAFFGSGVDITTDATFTDLHTATGNSVITSLLLANDDGVNDVKARVVWTDGANAIQGYLCFDMIVPADATVELLEKVKYLPSGHKIRVYANVGGRLEAIIAGRTL